MKRVVAKYRFTLVEIMVSMGVFLILLTMLLNFFSGTRQVWRTLRERNEAFENSRIAMNLMTDLLSTSIADGKNIGFLCASNSGGQVSECTFFTHSLRQLTPASNTSPKELGNLYAVKIYAKNTGELCIASEKIANITGELSTSPTVSANEKVIIKGVSKLTFTTLIPSYAVQPSGKRPLAIELQLELFDNVNNFKIYNSMQEGSAKKDFAFAHTYTFTRTISFDNVEDPIYEVKNEPAP